MGKKKIQISKIQDEKVCQLTFYKRRKGVLKKAMELALLCGVDVFVTIIDLKQTFTFFTSSGTPKEFIDNNLSRLNRINIHKSYSVDDYQKLFEKKKKSKKSSESDDEDEKTITFDNSDLKSECFQKGNSQETPIAFKEFTFQEKDNNLILKEDTNKTLSPYNESKTFENSIHNNYNLFYKPPPPYQTNYSSSSINPNYIRMKRNRNDDVIHFLSRNTCYRQNQYINNNSKFNIYNEFYSRNNFEHYDEKTNIFDEFDKEYGLVNNNRYEENNNDIFNFNNYNTPGLPLPFKHKIYSTRTKEEYLF